MTRADKIKLANALIAEDRNCNIRDYLVTVAEIEAVERACGTTITKQRATSSRPLPRRAKRLRVDNWGVHCRGTIHLSLTDNTE